VGRWAIYIDLEGFSKLYDKEAQILLSLGDLMEGIYQIGCLCYPEPPDRLFAHQTGDGFVIVSEFPETTLDRPIAIALALLRHVAMSGRFAKASVAEGEFGDIKSCYPEAVRDFKDYGTVRLGQGVLTLFPVMGTALIRAVLAIKDCPSGPLLAIRSSEQERLPAGLVTHEVCNSGLTVVDWINSNSEQALDIAQKAGLKPPNIAAMSHFLRDYCRKHDVKKEWSLNVEKYLEVALE